MDKAEAIIKKEGVHWIIYNHDGSKKLGVFDSHEAALKRLRQIEFFKHKTGGEFRLDVLSEYID